MEKMGCFFCGETAVEIIDYPVNSQAKCFACNARGRLHPEADQARKEWEEILSAVSFDKLLTTQEAAEYLDVSVQTIKNYIYKHKILKPIRKGRMLLFREFDLERLERPKTGRKSKKATES